MVQLMIGNMLVLSACTRMVSAFVNPRNNCRILPLGRQLYSSVLSDRDDEFLTLAVQHARNGMGHTFPNPAVGCVIVDDASETVLGAGFHPQAGMPHAEVFALLQAAGHVADGVEAAKSIVNQGENPDLMEQVKDLTDKYLAPSGASTLFDGALAKTETTTTAYVTLEPCCHVGKTPPCASSLVLAQVDRVVIGFRDPNPRVDGGGTKILEDAGIEVLEATGAAKQACADLVTNFCKRISPRDDIEYDEIMNGSKRRALRSLSGRLKADNSLAEVSWGGPSVSKTVDDLESSVAELPLKPSWMEATDALLWQHELILLRLNNAVAKKKGAKLLGERIADELGAHVAQVVGHTALLYRPSVPPVLDLESISKQKEEKS